MVSHTVTSNNGSREHVEPAGCWSVPCEPVDSEPVAWLGQVRATGFSCTALFQPGGGTAAVEAVRKHYRNPCWQPNAWEPSLNS